MLHKMDKFDIFVPHPLTNTSLLIQLPSECECKPFSPLFSFSALSLHSSSSLLIPPPSKHDPTPYLLDFPKICIHILPISRAPSHPFAYITCGIRFTNNSNCCSLFHLHFISFTLIYLFIYHIINYIYYFIFIFLSF